MGVFVYLKWENELLGIISPDTYEVEILKPHLNATVELLIHGKDRLSAEEWRSFLSDRIVSGQRMDIEKILYQCGISRYDVIKIAEFTRAFNAKDKCWISFDADEKYEDCLDRALGDVLLKNRDISGDSAHSPGGQQVKHYGFLGDKFGIYKRRLHPLSTDVESEVAVSLLAEQMGVGCCPAVQVDENTVFSRFMYDFNLESIVHFRNLFALEERIDNGVEDILRVRPQYETELFQMLVLDFVTHQEDRHLSNYAVKISGEEEMFYLLYDNGRSLFFQDSEALVAKKCTDPVLYCNSFGPVGTQWDALTDMLKRNPGLASAVNLEMSDGEIEEILRKAKITGYRLDGAKVWIRKSIDCLKELLLEYQMKEISKDGPDGDAVNISEDGNEENFGDKASLDDKLQDAAERREAGARGGSKEKETPVMK